MRRPCAGEPASPWCCGWAPFEIERFQNGETLALVVAVACRLPTGEKTLALLDTGAQWTVIGGELAKRARPHACQLDLEPIAMQTRRGTVSGAPHTLRLTLVAETGDDLVIDATVLLADDWTGPMVIGYRGLLERVLPPPVRHGPRGGGEGAHPGG